MISRTYTKNHEKKKRRYKRSYSYFDISAGHCRDCDLFYPSAVEGNLKDFSWETPPKNTKVKKVNEEKRESQKRAG